MTPAEEVADARDKLRFTRREFANALGLGPRGISQVQRWEKGTVKPNEATMTAIRLMVRVQELEQWEPIESAKDQFLILGYCPDERPLQRVRLLWRDPGAPESPWLDTVEDKPVRVTHWQPRPKAPDMAQT